VNAQLAANAVASGRVIQYRFANADELAMFGLWRDGADWESPASDETGNSADSRILLAYELHPDSIAAATPQILAGIRIQRRIGTDLPRYWYHVGCVVHAAEELGLFHRERTLLLGNDYTGASELSALYVDKTRQPASQQASVTQHLLRAALAILQLEMSAAEQTVRIIYALPGLRDPHDRAPFWEGLGRHFYPGDIHQAQARFGNLWLTHVAALLPRHPIVVSLLDPNAQAAIGTAHNDTAALREALAELGFRLGQHVTLYDAGPIYETQIAAQRSAWQSFNVRIAAQLSSAQSILVSATLGQQICLIDAQIDATDILITRDTALLLSFSDDQSIWIAR
jgi:arginine/ornithine succinyltransferase subunit-like protein